MSQSCQVRLKVLQLSLDPAMRGWMNEGKSYIPPVGIGEVMRALGIGKVVASKNPKVAAGDMVSGGFGIQEYFLADDKDLLRAGLAKVDLGLGTPPQLLNALGMPGMAAYFGLLDIGQPKSGETVVVFDYADRYGVAVKDIAQWMKEGKFVSREDVVPGIENFPDALNKLFNGENFGKLVLKVAEG